MLPGRRPGTLFLVTPRRFDGNGGVMFQILSGVVKKCSVVLQEAVHFHACLKTQQILADRPR